MPPSFGLAEEHQLFRLLHRERFEQHRIQQTEDGRVRAYAQRQREHNNQREAGLLQQHSHAVAQVLPECYASYVSLHTWRNFGMFEF